MKYFNIVALEVLGSHGKVFANQLQKDSVNLFDDIYVLCLSANQELKVTANEAIEKISVHIADSLLEQNLIHKDSFKYLLYRIKYVLEAKHTNILVNTAISLIGIFSKSIVRFMGENMLQEYLDELLLIFNDDIIYSIGLDSNKESESLTHNMKPSKSIRYVLAKQKQYISMLNAYSNIISNLKKLNEFVVNVIFHVKTASLQSSFSIFFESFKILRKI
jgi:hypothetical protein